MAVEMTHKFSSFSRLWKYDVFLSFCGQDTRKNFTDHLFDALVREGINTFRDDKELNKGENIYLELMEAIQGSRIAIIVFSKNYASSTWCLRELVKILECKKDCQIEKVLPVFYKVDPSNVRKQSNTYARAFMRHERNFKGEMEKVKAWRTALTEAANFSGWDQTNFANGHEVDLIKKIVEEVLTIVKPTCLDVPEHLIGLESHIERMNCLLNDGGSDVRIIGIYGPGGIGKTTIAKVVYNKKFRNFEGSSFLANVREVLSQHDGLVRLQKQLLSNVLKNKDIDIDNGDQGINFIKNLLCRKRVLIVLDDVEKIEQLDKLVGKNCWFYPGSCIVVTTRDEHLLTKLDVDENFKYRVDLMDQNESFQLFCHHAFRQDCPLEDYVQLSNDVINYAGGLPLALVVMGSLLYKRGKVEWEWQLEKLKKIPNSEISKKLEISYNALDELDQSIFLDVSCYFIGEHKDFVITFLDGCGLSGEAGIKLLTERSLITVEGNRLCMHDLVRDLGREIVRKKSENPGGRSRLWDQQDVINVLINLTGTDTVEGLRLDLSRYNVEELGQLTIEGFFRMPNLRLLDVSDPNSRITIDGKHSLQIQALCLRKLVWLRWEGFPFQYIPSNFCLANIVTLDMQESKLKEVWKGPKYLKKLKVLNLSYSFDLTHTPDLSGLLNLEKLYLFQCVSLVEVHESIDHLKKLVALFLAGCHSLRNLPSGITKLASLERLCIFGCSKLLNLPEGIGKLESLTLLEADSMGIIELPSFSGYCSLKFLSLRWSKFKSLPSGITQLLQLRSLDVSYCENLQSIPMLPSNVTYLCAYQCSKLIRLPNLSNLKHLATLILKGCKKLAEIEGLAGLNALRWVNLLSCINLTSFAKKRIFQDIFKDFANHEECDICFDGDEVSEWFGFQSESKESISCQVTQPRNTKIQGLILYIVFSPKGDETLDSVEAEVVVVNETKNFTWSSGWRNITNGFEEVNQRITWVTKIPNCHWKTIAGEYGDTIKVSVQLPRDAIAEKNWWVNKIGVRFVYASQTIMRICQKRKIPKSWGWKKFGVRFFYDSHNMRIYRKRKISKHH